MNQYIKVTLAGETKSHILMATLRDFYLSQGAKIEIPTEEEVLAVLCIAYKSIFEILITQHVLRARCEEAGCVLHTKVSLKS